MLTRSLCCFRGISPEAERRLWQAGCLSWDCLPRIGGAVSVRKAIRLAEQLPELREALAGRVADYFLARLPPGYRLRVAPEFEAGLAFLDIETTGLSPASDVTVIGLWQSGHMTQFVRGRNLHDFLAVWRRIEVVVTFNGIRFDLPFLMRQFGLRCAPPHIDLQQEARIYGFSGGLKAIEKPLGIVRTPDEEGDGAAAVDLWRKYSDRNDEASLAQLLRYNERDVRSLAVLSKALLKRSFDNFPGPTFSFSTLFSG